MWKKDKDACFLCIHSRSHDSRVLWEFLKAVKVEQVAGVGNLQAFRDEPRLPNGQERLRQRIQRVDPGVRLQRALAVHMLKVIVLGGDQTRIAATHWNRLRFTFGLSIGAANGTREYTRTRAKKRLQSRALAIHHQR